jgi:RimJ/RimL family protein N-acetyltransferase
MSDIPMPNNKTAKAEKHVIDLINHLKLETQRLTLKKFIEKDIEFNVEHAMNPEIMRYIKDPQTIEETRKITTQIAKDWIGNEGNWVLFALTLKETGKYIGMVCFRYESIENDTVEMGWRLGLEYHGKGYATEAAQALLDFIKQEIKPHKVVAYCVAENIGSSNIMTKLGMQHEATLREFSKLGGQWFDEAIYGIILNS